MTTKKDELIQEYGLKLAQQALWSPVRVREIAECALSHCDAPTCTKELDSWLAGCLDNLEQRIMAAWASI